MTADIKHHGAFKWDTDAIDRVMAKPRNKLAEIAHEGFVRKLKHCQDDAEKMVDYCRDMQRCRVDATPQLDEAETFIKSLLLAVLLLKREHSVTE